MVGWWVCYEGFEVFFDLLVFFGGGLEVMVIANRGDVEGVGV